MGRTYRMACSSIVVVAVRTHSKPNYNSSQSYPHDLRWTCSGESRINSQQQLKDDSITIAHCVNQEASMTIAQLHQSRIQHDLKWDLWDQCEHAGAASAPPRCRTHPSRARQISIGTGQCTGSSCALRARRSARRPQSRLRLGAWRRVSVRWRPREEDAPPGRRIFGMGRSPGYSHHHTIRPNT